MIKLSDSLELIKGVGPSTITLFKQLNIRTVDNLLNFYPRKYIDFSNLVSIKDIQPGPTTIKGEFIEVNARYVRRSLHITEAILSDKTGSIKVVWFNQPYRKNMIESDKTYYLSGSYDYSGKRYQIVNPLVESGDNLSGQTARIIPVYRETKGLKSHKIRQTIFNLKELCEDYPENLPQEIVDSHELMSKAQSLWQIHFPTGSQEFTQAKHRLGFEELYQLQLAAQLNKRDNQTFKSVNIEFKEKLAKEFVDKLPFNLTDAQKKAAWEAIGDMSRDWPANRLIEGDVGSGKTVVAAFLSFLAVKSGFQVALMAPTELLANQHWLSFKELLSPHGIQVNLLSSKTKNPTILKDIKSGESTVTIGTHALFQDDVEFNNLNLVIIDEQHRFGVEQRKSLRKKAKHLPHLIALTATPIPRSLGLVIYSELDISIIDELPKNRSPITTKIIADSARQQAVAEAKNHIERGEQVFWVCPNINSTADFSSAEFAYQQLSQKFLKDYKVGLIHGQLKSEQQQQIMQDMLDKKIDCLVSTTVIEVGVDVANATLMIIESAQNFGLAQLHQLRGRVGRSDLASTCIALTDADTSNQRLKFFANTTSGFALAEYDLEKRGPGAIFGTRQSGDLDLRFANISDSKTISEVKQAVDQTIDQNLMQPNSVLAKTINTLRKTTRFD